MTEEEYLHQAEPNLAKYVKAVDSIIDSQPPERRQQLGRLFDSPLGEQFMLAPASTRRRFHNAFNHGLVDHSLRVVKNALKISQALWPSRWAPEKVSFTALLHDFGKAGRPGKPFYIPVAEEWKAKKGEYWEIGQDVWAPNSEAGIWTLLKEGVVLEDDEIQSLRLNDGMGPPENKPYSFHEDPLALVIHWADHAAMRMEKEMDK